MANETRIRTNWIDGKLLADLAPGALAINHPRFALLPVVTAAEHLPIMINPGGDPSGPSAPEVVWVVNHLEGDDDVTVLRGQEGTTAKLWRTRTPWAHGPTVLDGGTTQVIRSAVPLGNRAGGASAYVWQEVPDLCRRGLMTQFVVTPSGGGPYLFDIELRDAAGGGNRYLTIEDATAAVELSHAIYIEGDADRDVFVGIKNRGAGAATFTLTSLRLERFA